MERESNDEPRAPAGPVATYYKRPRNNQYGGPRPSARRSSFNSRRPSFAKTSTGTCAWLSRSLAYRRSSMVITSLIQQKRDTQRASRKRERARDTGENGNNVYARRKVPRPLEARRAEKVKREWQDLKKYFREVDDFPLLEESPSPIKPKRKFHSKPRKSVLHRIEEMALPPETQDDQQDNLDTLSEEPSNQNQTQAEPWKRVSTLESVEKSVNDGAKSLGNEDNEQGDGLNEINESAGVESVRMAGKSRDRVVGSEACSVADMGQSCETEHGESKDQFCDMGRLRISVMELNKGDDVVNDINDAVCNGPPSISLHALTPEGDCTVRRDSRNAENTRSGVGDGCMASEIEDPCESSPRRNAACDNRGQNVVEFSKAQVNLEASPGSPEPDNEENGAFDVNFQNGEQQQECDEGKDVSDVDILEEDTDNLGHLEQLLNSCKQQVSVDSLPTMDEVLNEWMDLSKVEKIGEGAYGEAFKWDDIVVKIVPMEGEMHVNGYPQKTAEQFIPEVVVSQMLSDLRNGGEMEVKNQAAGFAWTRGVRVCQGKYSESLVEEWNRWHQCIESENDPVDSFMDDQLYVMFFLEDAGVDLEHFEIRRFEEAKSMLMQATFFLAVGEEACQFEHRDLHWGNILLRSTQEATGKLKLRGQDVEFQTKGINVVLIDFTLSRLQVGKDDIAFANLSTDPELFQGPKRDCQADTYRRMKKVTKDRWREHWPATNCLWIHYLADTLLNLKSFPMSSSEKRELRGFRSRALKSKGCFQLIWDEFFEGMWFNDS